MSERNAKLTPGVNDTWEAARRRAEPSQALSRGTASAAWPGSATPAVASETREHGATGSPTRSARLSPGRLAATGGRRLAVGDWQTAHFGVSLAAPHCC